MLSLLRILRRMEFWYMNKNERDLHLLKCMYDYCLKIEKTINRFGKDIRIFINDTDYQDSIGMNILQIGELSGRLSESFILSTRDEMDWRAIKGMRNMFAHNYNAMDIDRIWETAIADIPMLKEFLTNTIKTTF